MKSLISILFLVSVLFAEFKTGDKISQMELKDQFDGVIKVDDSFDILVVANTKEGGKIGHLYFEDKNNTTSKKVLYISDMSKVPTFVLDFFMMGSFKKYSYKMALLKDEKISLLIPKKGDELTILYLDKLQIKDIKFAKTKEEIKALVEK